MLTQIQRSEALYAALGSMINIINNHSEILEQASFTAKGISASLENAAAVARSLNETLNLSGPLGDWALRFCIPLSSVFIGSYGLPPTPVRNAFLLLFGGSATTARIELQLTFDRVYFRRGTRALPKVELG